MRQFVRSHILAAAGAAALLGLAQPALAQKTIAIAVNGPHAALKATEDAFKAELVRLGYAEGKDVVFRTSMGNFTPALIPQLLAQAEASNPALLLTITTPVTQTARSVIKNPNLPIVFTVVSDPVKAQVVPSWEKGSDRFVGVSNFQNMDAMFAFAKQLFPSAKTVGLLFNPGEANDVAHVEAANAAGAKQGIAVRTAAVDNVNDIAPRVQALRGVDFIYILPSNMLIPAAPAISAASAQINVPLISSSSPIVRQHGAVASYGVDYTKQGQIAARMADQILKGRKTSDMANHRPEADDNEAVFSARQLERFKAQVPAAWRNCAACLVQ